MGPQLDALETWRVFTVTMYILSFVLLLWNIFLGYKFIKITFWPEPEPIFLDSDNEKEE